MVVVMGKHSETTTNTVSSTVRSDVVINTTTTKNPIAQHNQGVKAMFHDFLGMKPTTTADPKHSDAASPAASLSTAAAASSSGGGRGPLSSTSDLASDKQVGNHLEGIPFYGPRSEISNTEISNRLTGSKRSNSDSVFTGSARDVIRREALESLHLMKMLKNGGGGEQSRRSNDDGVLYGMQQMRPTSTSHIMQPSPGSRRDANLSKWDQAIPIGTSGQHPPRGSQFVPLAHQVHANRIRDTNAAPSIISQSAADEGSRTGIRGPGILATISAGSGAGDKITTGLLSGGVKPKSGQNISEPESSIPSSRPGLTSASRQMTIFYGGQAHVFDEVHPNKADVIMALAGSNGGSWSTNFSQKPTVRPCRENVLTSGEYEPGAASNSAFQQDLRGRLPVTSNAGPGSFVSSGVHRDSAMIVAKETRTRMQARTDISDEKR